MFKKMKCSEKTNISASDDLSIKNNVLYQICRKLGLWQENPTKCQTKQEQINISARIKRKVKNKEKTLGITLSDIPEPPPLSNDDQFNVAMDSIRAFELEQISYKMNTCKVCQECRIDLDVSKNGICKKCANDKENIKMFSDENCMDPKPQPKELQGLSIIEQQLISRTSPCINVFML